MRRIERATAFKRDYRRAKAIVGLDSEQLCRGAPARRPAHAPQHAGRLERDAALPVLDRFTVAPFARERDACLAVGALVFLVVMA